MELTFPTIWVPKYLRRRGERENVKAAGLINGGMVNDGHALVNGGTIRAKAAGFNPAVPPVTGAAYYYYADIDTYQDPTLLVAATADGAVLEGWKDQTANARHITMQVGGTPSQLKTGGPNSKNYARADTGGQDGLSATFILAQPVTVFLVMRLNVWSTSKAYIMDGVGGDSMDLHTLSGSSPQMKLFAGTGSTNTNGDLTLGTWGIVCCVFSGAASRLRVNAGTAATGNPGTSTTGGLTLFHNGSSFAGTSGANVDIAACIGYPSALVAGTDETLVRDWLNGIYTIF